MTHLGFMDVWWINRLSIICFLLFAIFTTHAFNPLSRLHVMNSMFLTHGFPRWVLMANSNWTIHFTGAEVPLGYVVNLLVLSSNNAWIQFSILLSCLMYLYCSKSSGVVQLDQCLSVTVGFLLVLWCFMSRYLPPLKGYPGCFSLEGVIEWM